jgi:hypothetical protein
MVNRPFCIRYTGIFTQPLEGKDYECPLPMDVPCVSPISRDVFIRDVFIRGSSSSPAVGPSGVFGVRSSAPRRIDEHFLATVCFRTRQQICPVARTSTGGAKGRVLSMSGRRPSHTVRT